MNENKESVLLGNVNIVLHVYNYFELQILLLPCFHWLHCAKVFYRLGKISNSNYKIFWTNMFDYS